MIQVRQPIEREHQPIGYNSNYVKVLQEKNISLGYSRYVRSALLYYFMAHASALETYNPSAKKKSESFLITFHEFWGILMELYLCFEKCQVPMQQYQLKLI